MCPHALEKGRVLETGQIGTHIYYHGDRGSLQYTANAGFLFLTSFFLF